MGEREGGGGEEGGWRAGREERVGGRREGRIDRMHRNT